MRTGQLFYTLLFISNLYLHRKVLIQDALIATISESLPKMVMKKDFVSKTNERKSEEYFHRNTTNKKIYDEEKKIQAEKEKEKEIEQDEQHKEEVKKEKESVLKRYGILHKE